MNKMIFVLAVCFVLCLGVIAGTGLAGGGLEPDASGQAAEQSEAQPAPTVRPQPTADPGLALQRTAIPLAPGEDGYCETAFMPVNDDSVPNKELEKYRFGQVEIRDNHLLLTAERQGDEYISGKVESIFSFLYGSIEFRINTMHGRGLFPAVWMLPANYDLFPEVDIYELIGSEPYRFYGVLHYLTGSQRQREFFEHPFEMDQIPESYVLRFEWTKDAMKWYLEDELIYTITEQVPQVPMYLIANLAVGGEWAGTPDDSAFPAVLDVEILEFTPGELFTR